MIIKLIAETEVERKRFGGNESVEHFGVKEYFLAGNKIDPEGSIVDFHEWNGGFRFLIGTLGYFYEVVNDDRRKSSIRSESELPINIGGNQSGSPMIRRGMGGNIQPLDISRLQSQTPSEACEACEACETEDGFVEDDEKPEVKPTLRFFKGESIKNEEIDVIAEDISNKVQKEVDQMKNKQGLRIIPNK